MSSNVLPSEGAVGWAASMNNAISAPQLNGFRLTLTSGTPVTTSDVTGATTICLTPYAGNRISLYDGTSSWAEFSSAEISLALGTLTSGKNYDVFVYDNSGAVAIDTLVAWTDDTNRATAITRQDGVWVKSGTTTRRYVGTFRTTSTTTTEDSGANRFLWNVANRIATINQSQDANNWTHQSATISALDGGNANWKHSFVVGVAEDPFSAEIVVAVLPGASSDARIGIGYDVANAFTSPGMIGYTFLTSAALMLKGEYATTPAVGLHYFQGGQQELTTTNAANYYGNNGQYGSGMISRGRR